MNISKSVPVGSKVHVSPTKSEKTVSKMYQCDWCGESITQKCHVNRHIISMREKKEYKCDQCDYTSNRKDDLARHITTVHNKKRRKDDWGDGDITASDVEPEKERIQIL